jgi:hypothetical protein
LIVCNQSVGLQSEICCGGTHFVPGLSEAACPQLLPGSDPRCPAPPFPTTCAINGLTCAWKRTGDGTGGTTGASGVVTTASETCCNGRWAPTGSTACERDGGAGGTGGAAGCPANPAACCLSLTPGQNPAACAPADQTVYHKGNTDSARLDVAWIPASCTPGATCDFVVGWDAILCTQASAIEHFVCCGGGYVLGTTSADCPVPVPNQDARCAALIGNTFPPGTTCPQEGLQCGFDFRGTASRFVCCGGVWNYVTSTTCAVDAGAGG